MGVRRALALLAVAGGVWLAGCVVERTTSQAVGSARWIEGGDVFVDLQAKLESPEMLRTAGVSFGDGWRRSGRSGLWVVGRTATMRLLVDEPHDRNLTMVGRAYSGLQSDAGQQMVVELNGVELGRVAVPRRRDRFGFTLPAQNQRRGENVVVLRFSKAVSPAEVGRGADPRPLAFWLSELTLESGEGDDRGGTTVVAVDAETEAVDEGGTRTVVVVERSGTLVVPLELDGSERELEIELRPTAEGGGGSAEARPRGVSGAGGEASLEPISLSPERESAGRTYSLAELRPGVVIVVLEIETEHGVEVGLAVNRVDEPLPRGTKPVSTAVDAVERPDIVVLILDAARPDHFGCYGYDRPTTPRIDRLARRSLVFRNVFALAPYTLCSVPTMVTGTSFLRHGVVRPQDRLADRALTLAEVLQERGYRTAAFSTTPNNSRARGLAQGFDHFYESWEELPDWSRNRDSFLLTRKVLRWLDDSDDGTPLFLLVHYVTPHEPYDPPPRFDVFSDPGYSGPVDGWYSTLKAIDRGFLEATAEDLRHVIDIYDGNLLRTDAAVRPLLRRLERRDAWDRTVVLVTSDHGEAMFEHGRATHNSTVYDEMLAVPFILRLPENSPSESIALGQLATLADMAPTLAGLAGAEMPGAFDGIDLLAPDAEIPNRYFVARTTGDIPVYGVRTRRWKAVLSPFGATELFDLDSDPGETRNLALRRFPLFTGLEMLAEQRMNAPHERTVTERTGEASDAELDALRTLGYVQ